MPSDDKYSGEAERLLETVRSAHARTVVATLRAVFRLKKAVADAHTEAADERRERQRLQRELTKDRDDD